MHTHAHTHTHIYIYSLTLQTLANVSSELFAKSKRLFNQISMLFSRNRGNQKKRNTKKNCLLMVKRNQNTIGLDLRPEAKRKPQQDRTRNVNVPRFRNVHKMHLMDIKIDRARDRDRDGV